MSYPILQFFGHEGLDDILLEVALPAGLYAQAMADQLPVCEETQQGLRKLLEARDCFIRAGMLAIAQEAEPDKNE